MERAIIETEGCSVIEIDKFLLEEIVEIVVKENYLHHQKNPENIQEEIDGLFQE